LNYKNRASLYLFGKGELAIYCAEKYLESSEKENLIIIPVKPEPTWTDSLINWANENNVTILDFEYISKNKISEDSIGISIYFDKILKNDLINKFYKIFNIHNSPLPKYRGVNPINWALKNGENKHGVTLHLIDEGIDTGPIVDQEIFNINQEMEVIDVYNLCIENGKKLIDNNLMELDVISAVSQSIDNISYYSKKDYDLLGDRKEFRRKI
jgi:methionyl-tRNA formyltransferase|tara:strand:+ start:7904 stop:8539 length:636 start_codon:yes stop_codon:yes gene_type:complete